MAAIPRTTPGQKTIGNPKLPQRLLLQELEYNEIDQISFLNQVSNFWP